MSFDIALSGIHAINEALETTSNNIANAGTYGFKSSRANFASVYAGTHANGVEVGSLTQTIGQNGSTQTTGRGLDAAIDGRGFFVARDPQGGLSYSRVGIFTTDTDGYLIDSNRKKVQGYGPTNGGALGAMGDIKVPTGQIPAVATTKVDFVGNMSADWKPIAGTPNPKDSTTYNMVQQSKAYDSLGKQHTISAYYVKTSDTAVDVYYAVDDAAVPATKSATLTFDTKGALTGTTPAAISVAIPATNGAAAGNVSFNYTGTTRFAGEPTTTTNQNDGYASGAFLGVSLAPDGSLVAKYSNDQPQIVGTLAIATFANEGALQSVSDTSWVANAESGTPLYNTPGVGLSGKLSTGALEGSNVDITSELVGLMTSQRNYQANSKVLTTENQMMQALMQAL
jgi:flagellar hook protein FlgE